MVSQDQSNDDVVFSGVEASNRAVQAMRSMLSSAESVFFSSKEPIKRLSLCDLPDSSFEL